ncbi:DeoR/GlpR family DNA-binding transcription regulator [Microbacterium sp. C7(2022)]|uniref:DeoR/GlpR family DNA-binding transcription regulator n=1 Tax=Microbacterium sp. C7(2022) TaxID=2992759 RepID=UPI00237AA393|nr:DeoR/GlpR family DNA-binding transcription regulator [Microbacterium sp. C7(2022)]MDE0545609.1 DeoR/GlpR family DNA-binding transcription regulator [Microbacterium sp. C7(2022)]
MYATERQSRIQAQLAETSRVSVVALARDFDVTTETIRRDLDQLERAGLLRRVHGGAVAPQRSSTLEPTLLERRGQHGVAKQRIARRAAAALSPSFRGSVFFDAGTTTDAVASEAAPSLGPGVEVVTHALSLALTLSNAPAATLSLIGGRVRGVTGAAVGSETVRAIESLRPDVAFVGTNGISAQFGCSTPDPDEAAVKRAIVRSARRVVVVADREKQDAELLVGFASLSDIDVLVTDAAPGAALAAALHDADVEVWVA